MNSKERWSNWHSIEVLSESDSCWAKDEKYVVKDLRRNENKVKNKNLPNVGQCSSNLVFINSLLRWLKLLLEKGENRHKSISKYG